jgi:hypothetical protein
MRWSASVLAVTLDEDVDVTGDEDVAAPYVVTVTR